MKKSLIAVAFAVMSLAPAAQAQPLDTMVSVSYVDVSYADLNLRTHAGATVMLNRIKFAARNICGGEPDIVDLKMRRLFKACVRLTTDNAVNQLDSPLVASLNMNEKVIEEHFAQR